MKGDFSKALAAFEQASAKDDRNISDDLFAGFSASRLGDKEKAAGSYARALNIDQKSEVARAGFARVGGKYGQTYQAF